MKVSLAVVVPVYRGAKYLLELCDRIDQLRLGWEQTDAPISLSECIFVDDDSSDGSAEILQQLSHQHPWVQAVTLSRNYGQHAATVAGICHSSADWVVTLDEDLQHDPALIDAFLEKAVTERADAVYARSDQAVHGGSWRDRASVTIKGLLARLSSVPEIRRFNSFRLLRGSIARAAASSSSSQTYFDIAISWFTNAYAYLDVTLEDKRFTNTGQSGYGLATLIQHARHLVISSHVDIAAKGIILGIFSTVVAILAGLWVLWYRLFGVNVPEAAGWASLVALLAFIGGIAIVLICICLEYINVLLLNQLGKPAYFTVDRSSDSLLRDWYAGNSVAADDS